MGRARTVTAGAIAALLAYGALDVVDVVPGWLTRQEPPAPADVVANVTPEAGRDPVRSGGPPGSSDGRDGRDGPAGSGAASSAASATGSATTGPAVAALPGENAPTPTRAGLEKVLGPLLADRALGSSLGVDIRDVRTGAVLYSRDADRPRMPASVTKILAASAVAHAADLKQRAVTAVVEGAPPSAGAPGEIVLVAGGDTLLSPGAGNPLTVAGYAGLGDLAGQVATALGASTKTPVTVRLGVDTSLAKGPLTARGWNPADLRAGYVTRVAMIGLAGDRADPGTPAVADPVASATTAFVFALAEKGVKVAGRPASASAPQGARQLGAVHAATTGDVLALALADSDNALTEAVVRRIAVADGAAPTFEAAAGWVRAELDRAGVPVGDVVLADSSGLAKGTGVPAAIISDILVRDLASTDRDVAALVSGLPVAALDGTLADRFRSPQLLAGAGLVRAKTGTLTGVGALAGTVVDADGRLLAFTVIADRVPSDGTTAARVALDRLTSALALCGCR